MPRPRSKDELIDAINAEFGKLCAILDKAGEALQKDFKRPIPRNSRDKNARDVLIHLYEWQVMLQNFITNNLTFKHGKFTPKATISPFLPPPFNWRTYPPLNVEIWQKHQSTSFESALTALKASHKSVLSLTQKFSNDELFNKNHFAFTGATHLGSYVIGASCSHYAWATKQLKSGLKS